LGLEKKGTAGSILGPKKMAEGNDFVCTKKQRGGAVPNRSVTLTMSNKFRARNTREGIPILHLITYYSLRRRYYIGKEIQRRRFEVLRIGSGKVENGPVPGHPEGGRRVERHATMTLTC